MKRIYLGGPVTGLPAINFQIFAVMITSRRAGYRTEVWSFICPASSMICRKQIMTSSFCLSSGTPNRFSIL